MYQTTDDLLDVWPLEISFLKLIKYRKAKCQLCGRKDEMGQYQGEGLKWVLCRKHAIVTRDWAKTNEPIMAEHATLERANTGRSRMERAANRLETKVRQKWSEREHYTKEA